MGCVASEINFLCVFFITFFWGGGGFKENNLLFQKLSERNAYFSEPKGWSSDNFWKLKQGILYFIYYLAVLAAFPGTEYLVVGSFCSLYHQFIDCFHYIFPPRYSIRSVDYLFIRFYDLTRSVSSLNEREREREREREQTYTEHTSKSLRKIFIFLEL